MGEVRACRRSFQLDDGCGEGDKRAVACVGFAATHGDPSVFLKLLEDEEDQRTIRGIVFPTQVDQMPPFVGVTVEFCGKPTIGFGRDDRHNPCCPEGLAQPVRIEGAVGEELAAGEALDQDGGSAQIVRLSWQEAEVDQVAECIGQRHDLAGYAAARAPDGLALGPPFAPCP